MQSLKCNLFTLINLSIQRRKLGVTTHWTRLVMEMDADLPNVPRHPLEVEIFTHEAKAGDSPALIFF